MSEMVQGENPRRRDGGILAHGTKSKYTGIRLPLTLRVQLEEIASQKHITLSRLIVEMIRCQMALTDGTPIEDFIEENTVLKATVEEQDKLYNELMELYNDVVSERDDILAQMQMQTDKVMEIMRLTK